MDTADQQSKGMRWARWSAVLVIVTIGVASFILSFAALRDLAVLANTPVRWAWLFPVIVDGTIIQATISALALAKSPERQWFLWVLAAGAAVSITCNSVHAIAAGNPLPGWACAIVAAIAPISLLIDTHGLALLFRAAQQDSMPVAAVESVAEPAADPVPDVVPAVASPVPAVLPVQSFHTPPRPVAPLLPVAVPIPTGGN